jgi:hypothetical protein
MGPAHSDEQKTIRPVHLFLAMIDEKSCIALSSPFSAGEAYSRSLGGLEEEKGSARMTHFEPGCVQQHISALHSLLPLSGSYPSLEFLL